jgi:nicotinamide phosphoribosyltransferase
MVVSLKDLIIEKGIKFVIRPDSGDPKESILKVFRKLYALAVMDFNSITKRMELPNWLGVLQGDGICIETVKSIVDALTAVNFSTKGLVFGQGGKLLQDHTRDDFGWAMKCSFAIVDGKDRDVYKDPITDSDKKSKKGKMKLIRPNGKYITILSSEDKQYYMYHTELKLVYSCDERKRPVHIVQNWDNIRQRVNDFIFN